MQTRLVENWLTSVKELSYTVPFAQLLTRKGFKVIHISRGGAVEEGKDIIAVDPKGEVHCYQLKYGNINTREWRAYKAELDELVEIPPKHPSLPNEVERWHSYLVTNGTLGNSVARTIFDWADTVQKRGFAEFKTILLNDLVTDFEKHFGDFFPTLPTDLHAFLSIYNENGDDTLDNGEFKNFFENYFLNIADDTKSKARRTESINASVILCSYLLTNKAVEENHLEIIKAWTLLLFTVLHFSEKFGIADKNIGVTEKLILDSIEIEYRPLIDEIASDGKYLVEGKYDPLSEPFVTYRLRCTELVGYLAAYMSMHAILGNDPYSAEPLFEKYTEMAKRMIIFGESSVPFFVNHIVYMNGLGSEDVRDAAMIGLINGLVSTHGRDKPGLPSPYYSVVKSVEYALGLLDEEITENFEGRSYTLWSLIMLAAKFNQKNIIEPLWRLITFISCQELEPKDTNDLLLWKVEDGVLHDNFPEAEQSWAALVNQAQVDHIDKLPAQLKNKLYLLPLFINTMPHRQNMATVLKLL